MGRDPCAGGRGRAAWRGVVAVVSAVWAAGPVAASDFVRGDANGDRVVDISDALFTLNYLFLGGTEPPCAAAADSNDDERVDVSDPQHTLNFLFLGGSQPPDPFPAPGSDPTPGLGCGLGPPVWVSCQALGPAVELRWELPEVYEVVVVTRDGEDVATLDGAVSSYVDRPARGGAHTYELRGGADGALGEAGACSVQGLPDNRAPSLALLSPTQGSIVEAETVEVRGRVSDDGEIARILIDGGPLPAESLGPVPFTFVASVGISTGPSLVRIEVIDDFGRATWGEFAIGRQPILPRDAFSRSVALHISGSSGYDEIETVVRPFLDDLSPQIDAAVRGQRIYEGSVLGAGVEVTARSASVEGTVGLDLFASSASGGRVGLRASVPRIRVLADGTTDFGFLGKDSWSATYTANDVTLTGSFAFRPGASGTGLEVSSDGFTADVGRSDLQVSGFLDPLGIFDSVVNLLVDAFEGDIEAEVEAALARTADEQLLPAIRDAFSNLNLTLDVGGVRLDTLYADAVESSAGLSLLLDAGWSGAAPALGFPRHAGSSAGFAPVPALPLTAGFSHPVDATFCFSEDTFNQVLLELVATGALRTELRLDDLGSPIPLTLGTLAAGLEPRLLALPGVSEDTPLGIRIDARKGPTVRIGRGMAGTTHLGAGTTWRYWKGASEPPSSWRSRSFSDAAWPEGDSGFGYSSEPGELLPIVTLLNDMPEGYTSLYIRTPFQVDQPSSLGGLLLRVLHDDGFVAYLNGTEVARQNMDGATGTAPDHEALALSAIEPSWAEIDLTSALGLLARGTNVLAIQGHNAAATSSDFVLMPELVAAPKATAGALSSVPAQLDVEDLVVTILAEGTRGNVDLFAFALSFRLQTEWVLAAATDGTPVLSLKLEVEDGPDPDEFPDAVVGGAAGLGIDVVQEAYDVDDELLLELARLLLVVVGPTLGESLAGLELPTLPLPALEFDTSGDAVPDVRLDVLDATLTPVDTDGGTPDWICVSADLEATSP